MKRERKKYTKAFKIDAVKLLMSTGKSVKQISEDLGIHENVLFRWKKEYKNLKDPFPGNGNPIEKELFELKKENAILKEEREILKKALAIFSGVKKL